MQMFDNLMRAWRLRQTARLELPVRFCVFIVKSITCIRHNDYYSEKRIGAAFFYFSFWSAGRRQSLSVSKFVQT